VPAHSFVLSGASPPFDAMFSGNWREAANSEVFIITFFINCFSNLKDIEVPDIVAGAFEKLMEYVYKAEAKLESMNIELAIGLYYAGTFFVLFLFSLPI
jgi:hypothetical protein